MMKKIFPKNINYPDPPSERFYFENYRLAWVRAGASVFMWLCALGGYFFNVLKINNIIGISSVVALLLLMNPLLLFILRKLKKNYILNFFTIFVNLIEIAAFTAILYFLGGVRALWLSPLYSVLIIYMGIAGRRGFAYIVATMCSVLMTAMVIMGYAGILPDQDWSENTLLPLSHQIGMVLTVSCCLYVIAFFSAYGGNLLKQGRKNLKDKNIELEEKNRALEQRERELIEAPLVLERRVRERTAELEKLNSMLSKEIHERQQAEEKLKENKNRLDEAQAVAHVGSWEFNIQTNALFWSNEMRRIYGYEPGEGKLPYDVFIKAIHPEDYERVITAVADAILSGTPYEIKYHIIRPSGEVRTSLSRCAVVKDENNTPIKLVGTGIDITDREKLEEEKQKLEEALRQSQKMEAIGTLAGGIAHEFNNILSIIIGNAEYASCIVPDENPIKEQLKDILSASFRARDVVKEILNFARQTKAEYKAIDIKAIIQNEIKLLRASIPSTIEIQSSIEDKIDTISGDLSRIKQILMNLSVNAVHAMSGKGGILEIGLENVSLANGDLYMRPNLAPGNFVKLTVKDTGHGIDPKNIKRIFDPYFTTKNVGEGTGLGLAVVHGIISEHGGGIRVSSEINKGTTFEIIFPSVSVFPDTEIRIKENLPKGTERILLVDDEKSIVLLNHDLLVRLGYTVKIDTNPLSAMKLFTDDPNQFDLVITDMTMPHMTGDRLAKEILKIKPDIPIIICTGYSEKLSKDNAKEHGIRKYLEKPISINKLAFAIWEVLDG